MVRAIFGPIQQNLQPYCTSKKIEKKRIPFSEPLLTDSKPLLGSKIEVLFTSIIENRIEKMGVEKKRP